MVVFERGVGIFVLVETKDQNTFLGLWGNRIEVGEYRNLQFTKSADVLQAMGLSPEKSPQAISEMRKNGFGVRPDW
jgi:hypothetical protein